MGLQRRGFNVRRPRRGRTQVRAQNSPYHETQSQRITDLPQASFDHFFLYGVSVAYDMAAAAVGATIYLLRA